LILHKFLFSAYLYTLINQYHKTMKTFLLLLSIALSPVFIAQEIVFTTKSGDNHIFWRMDVATPMVYENLSTLLEAKATTAGSIKGPISISHTGNFYIFHSDRFASGSITDGYEAITICSADLSTIEVPTFGGKAFHGEGIMQISNDGKTIYFVQKGSHDRDIFKSVKTGNTWSDPVELTKTSTFTHHLSPYLSYDETKILFEASNDPYVISTIKEMSNSGANTKVVTSVGSISNAKQIKSPCYDVTGNIYFEGETDAERIWKMASGTATPTIIKSSFTNDNSPVTTPDGKIISLYLPNSTHQLKIMQADGSSDVMLSATSGSFTELEDIGISAGGTSVASLSENLLSSLKIFPNPTIGNFKLHATEAGEYTLNNELGQTVQTISLNAMNNYSYEVKGLKEGVYILLNVNGGVVTHKIVVAQ
jgi:Tol biopolymer transport system component